MAEAAEVLDLTADEVLLLRTYRALPPEKRERATRYVRSLRFKNPVIPADPEAAKRLGEPGPPMWHVTADEEREMTEFLRACERVGMDE